MNARILRLLGVTGAMLACDSDSPFRFFDDFNRPDGTLGPNWIAENETIFISGGRLCSDDSREAFTNFDLGGQKTRVSFKFFADTLADVLAGAEAADDGTFEQVWFAGLATNDGVSFNLVVTNTDSEWEIEGPLVSVSAGVTYVLECVFDGGTVLVRLLHEDGALIGQFSAVPPVPNSRRYLGVGLGGEGNGQRTYVDDFHIEVLE